MSSTYRSLLSEKKAKEAKAHRALSTSLSDFVRTSTMYTHILSYNVVMVAVRPVKLVKDKNSGDSASFQLQQFARKAIRSRSIRSPVQRTVLVITAYRQQVLLVTQNKKVVGISDLDFLILQPPGYPPGVAANYENDQRLPENERHRRSE